MEALGGGALSYERGTPVLNYQRLAVSHLFGGQQMRTGPLPLSWRLAFVISRNSRWAFRGRKSQICLSVCVCACVRVSV